MIGPGSTGPAPPAFTSEAPTRSTEENARAKEPFCPEHPNTLLVPAEDTGAPICWVCTAICVAELADHWWVGGADGQDREVRKAEFIEGVLARACSKKGRSKASPPDPFQGGSGSSKGALAAGRSDTEESWPASASLPYARVSTSRTFLVRSSGVNGLRRKARPDPLAPACVIISSVYPEM